MTNLYCFEKPLTACCGYGGPPYNYNANITCGHGGSNVCEEGSRFISWDTRKHCICDCFV
ncbi:hypothetical protein AALP_AA1G097700 [Arabis alpina]|uniref:Uncharacterized protein n=1 Tax=Arabis alpina TaxID=50452 RepID=A0A087HM85_ARAAL|nr:hypothetical protein AALP_AA1G097700 [Arabis alpina]